MTASDVVIVEAVAVGPDAALCALGSHAAAAVAYCAEIPVWLVAGRGRRLPEQMWAAMVERLDGCDGHPWDRDVELVPLAMVQSVVGPDGFAPAEAAAFAPECPMAHELLRMSAM